MVDAVDPALGEALPATPVEAAGPPGVLEGHILTLREALATATAATAEARRLAEQRGETLEAQALAHEAALAERDSMLAAGATALRDSRAALLALANRRSWEIVAHAAQLSEATRATQAARAELAAASLRFQTASQAIVAATEAEAAALRQQVAAAERDRDAARQALAHWRRGGRLARMLRAFIG